MSLASLESRPPRQRSCMITPALRKRRRDVATTSKHNRPHRGGHTGASMGIVVKLKHWWKPWRWCQHPHRSVSAHLQTCVPPHSCCLSPDLEVYPHIYNPRLAGQIHDLTPLRSQDNLRGHRGLLSLGGAAQIRT